MNSINAHLGRFVEIETSTIAQIYLNTHGIEGSFKLALGYIERVRLLLENNLRRITARKNVEELLALLEKVKNEAEKSVALYFNLKDFKSKKVSGVIERVSKYAVILTSDQEVKSGYHYVKNNLRDLHAQLGNFLMNGN